MAPYTLRTSKGTPILATQKIAAIYARVSTRDQADKGYSLPQQIDACCRLAQQEGYVVPAEHIFQEDVSGGTLQRSMLIQMRKLVTARTVQAVYVYSLDRLARVLLDQLILTQECIDYGVLLRVVTLPAQDNSPESTLSQSMIGSFNEFDRQRILRRTKDGLIGRAKAGYPPGGRVPLGYTYVKHVGKGGHYEIDEAGAATVRYIFHLYVEEGLSMEAIAERLTREQVQTHQERHGHVSRYGVGVWHLSVVARILKNEAYIGRLL
jgi:site-specific DNA recombinase